MARRHAFPVVLPLPQRDILHRPVAELLEPHLNLLSGSRDVLQRRVSRARPPFQDREEHLGRYPVRHQRDNEPSRDDGEEIERDHLPHPKQRNVPHGRRRLHHSLGHTQAPLWPRSNARHILLEQSLQFPSPVDLVDDLGQSLLLGGRHAFDYGVQLDFLNEFLLLLLLHPLLLLFLLLQAVLQLQPRVAMFVVESEGDGIQRNVLHPLRMWSLEQDDLNTGGSSAGDERRLVTRSRGHSHPRGVYFGRLRNIGHAQDMHRRLPA